MTWENNLPRTLPGVCRSHAGASLKAYFVNSVMFKMIKALPAELQVRKIDGEEEEKKEED